MKKSTNGRSRATRYLRMQQLLIVVLALMMVFQFSTPTLGGLVWASDDEASAERQSTEDYQTEELKQVEITADTDTEETVEQTAQDQNDTSVDVTDDDETSAEKADDVQETEQNGDTDSKEASAQSGSNLSSEENDSNPDTVDTAHPTDKTDDGSDDETTQKDDESGDVTDKETDDVSEKETADDSDKSEDQETVAEDETAEEDDYAVDYVNKDGLIAVNVQGKAAESRKFAVEALAEEEDVNRSLAKELADEIFRDFDGPYTPVTIDGFERSADGTNIEGISAKWVTSDTVDDGDPLHLYVKPEGDNRQSVMLQVDYHLSGQYDYGTGEVKIIIPAYIFTKRHTQEGEGPNYGNMIIPYPEDNNNTDDFKWSLEGDHYVLTNVNPLSAATKGFIRFTIAGMLPHDLIDMMESEPFSADIYVVTRATNKVLGLRSNSLTATFDTDAALTSVEKKQAGHVQIVTKDSIPVDQRIAGEEYYVLINWYMVVSTTSNTYYSLDYVDELIKNSAGKTYDGFIVQSYSNVTSDGTNGPDTVSTNAGTSNAFYGYRAMNGNTYMVQTAYPYSQFSPSTQYEFKNKVTFSLTEEDHPDNHETKSATATVKWSYEDPKWPSPGGHFMVNKNGNDGADKDNKTHNLAILNYTWNDIHLWNHLNNGYYGTYATALNDLREGNDVTLSYTIDSVGYVMPWLFDSTAPASEDGQPAAKSSRNYTRSVEIITEDTGMSIGRTIQDDSWDIPESATLDSIPLVAGTDYTLTSLEFPGSPYVYKAMPQRIGANGSVSATTYSDGTFKYVKDTNDANWPDVDIYIQTGGSSTWTKYATFSWKNDGFELESGGTVSGRKLELPENTTNFKTVVMLQNDPENEANDENYAIQAGINYDVRVETKLDHTSSTLMNKVNASFDESNAPQLYIFNSDRMTCNRADGNHDQIVVINRDGYNTVRGFELDTMVSPFKDGDFDESVDFVNGIATIHYSARIEEKTLISDEASYDQAVADGKIPVERNVIWRDLLPAGMTPDLNSIDLVREDDVLNYAYYVSIKELKPEYTGPDRYLMVVSATLSNEPEVYSGGEDGDVKYYYDVPQIKFDASIDLKSILGYGYDRSRIHNVISFESLDIKDLGTVENYQGEPDDPHANRNIATAEAFENEIEKTLMTDLDPDNDDNRFLYAGTYTRLVVPTAAISNLDKVVQVNNENRWSTGVYAGNKEANERLVYLDGTYRYRLSYSPDSADAVARNIILYDSLENFYAGSGNDGGIDEGAPRWQGTFAGVDTSMLEAQGCDPEVWYSTETNLLIASEENENQAHQVNTVLQGPVWVKASEYTGDLSLVKAIAVDASKSKEKDENGEPLDFEVEYGHSASVIINMKAPTVEEANENHYIYNESGEHIHGVFGDSAQAYNNAYVLCETYVGDPNASEHTFVRKDYTKVGLFNYDISVDKEWDDEDDRDGKRPESVIIQLWTEDGPVEGQEVELPLKDDNGEYILDDEGNYIWTYTFRYIPYTDEDGNVINYFFKEKEDPENPSEYSATSRIDGNKITLINKHKPERTEISGVKSWVGDSEEVRPTRIRVDLYADGEYLKCQYVSASTNWKWSFTNLYKYRDGGIPIEYTVVENEDYNDLDSYITTYGEDEIINTYHPYGDLKVHKKITDATDASKDAEFEFVFDFTHKVINDEGQTVTETLPGPFQYEILDEETGEFITGGEIMSGGSLKIKGGQIIHIIEIDEGAHYEITELETDGYYNNERTGYSGTIKPNTIVEANYENTYSTRGRADLKATKYFENHQIENYQFAYEVYLVTLNDEGEEVETLVRTATSSASGNTPYQTLEDGTVIYDAGVSLGAFSYSLKDNGKTFTYRIKERIPEDADSSLTAEGITYDDTVYTATVTVTDNGDGTMTCTVVYYDADGNEITDPAFRPSFYNVYKAEGQINLPAWKNLVGRKPVDGEFTFALLDENGEPVLDENGEAITTTNVGSEIIFPAIHYTEKDAGKSYRYKAVEIPGDDPNVHYTDKAIGYIVTVNDNNDGTLNPTYVFADPDTWETEGVGVGEFVNTLEPGGLKVTKKISEDSEDYDENQTFTFKIKFIGDVEGITFPEGFTGWDADTKTATVVLHGDETFEITNIPAGTDYQVTEQNLDGWIPISQENVSGTIITSEVAEATITNQYQPDMATVQLFGTKKLDNKAAEAGLFTFTLDEKSNTSGKIKIINERGKVVEVDLPLTVTNTDGGFIQFPIIVYDEPGEHTYTIKETVGDDDTINYDAHEETVKVTVTADANGMLLTTIDFTTGDVEFENKTYPGGLKITKEADTDQYTDDEFYFLVTLYNEDGQPLSEDGTIYWYTEKTDTSGLSKFLDNVGETIRSGWESVKTWASETWEDIKEIFTEPLIEDAYGAEGDVELPVSGTFDNNIPWQITAEGELIIGDGNTYTMNNYSNRENGSWPWNAEEYNGLITSVSVQGTINARGSLKGMFNGTWREGYSEKGGHANLTSIDLTGLNTTNATSMASMFYKCSGLTSITFGDNFHTDNVTSMSAMFQGCSSLTSLDVSSFNTGNVTLMDNMFNGCSSLTTLNLSGLNTSNVTSMSNLFTNCKSLTTLDVSSFNTGNVTVMASMFYGCSGLTSLNVSNFDTRNVTSMSTMFYGCKTLTSLDLSNFNTANVTSFSAMFLNCESLASLDISSFNTANATSMSSMFGHCYALTSIDVSSFDTSKVKDMTQMFMHCTSLASLDLSNFDTRNVESFTGMFRECFSLASLDVSSFRTPSATKMNVMFFECRSLTSVDVSNFDTSHVTNMSSMFRACRSLSSLDVTNFDTSNVTIMGLMFYDCVALEELDLSSFDTSKATEYNTTENSIYDGMAYMFANDHLKKVILGPDFSFNPYPGDETHSAYTPVLNTPSSASPYTGKWIREDGLYGPYTPWELSALYNNDNPAKEALAGVWIWETLDGTCKVRFDANGGYTDAQTQILDSDDDTVTMPGEGTTMRPGYDLVGWSTDPDGNGTVYAPDEVVSGLFDADTTKTFYAIWESTDKLHYVVEHYQQDTDLRGYTLAEREVLKIPVESSGETVTPDVRDYPGFISPETQSEVVDGDYTVTIKYYYDRITYTIKFDANGGEGEMDDLVMLGDVSRRLPENEFTKENSIFKGWNTEPDGSGTYYSNAQRVNNLAGNGETITLYAQWITNENGEVTPTNGQIIVHCKAGETIVIPDLPAGTTYTVQEIPNPNSDEAVNGWTQTGITGNDGVVIPGSNGQAGGNIVSGTDDQVKVNNAYKAKGQIVLRARKVLEGSTLDAGDYTFVLVDEDGQIIGTKTCSADGSVIFDAITYEYEPGADPEVNDLGTHTYTIYEVTGEDGYINYDSHVETVTVEVTDPHLDDVTQGGALDVNATYSTEDGAVFTNTKENVDISGVKTWDDSNDQDGLRPESIIIHLFADGEEVDSKTVTSSNDWSWSFTNLPKYDYDKEGDDKEIVYTITEEPVEDYDTEVNGYDVTNTHEPEKTSISGSKTWDDKNNQDGARPASITIHLFADGVEVDSKTVTAADGWNWEFTDLPKYKEGGNEIVYTITEDEVEDYTTTVNGYDVKNTHKPETTSLSGKKTWSDGDNMDGIRPTSIVIYLYADGELVDTKTVTAADGWSWLFSNLPKYHDGGQTVVYTIEEKQITGYTAEVSGYNVTNTHYTATGNVTFEGTKTLENKTLEAGAFTFLIMEGDTEIGRATNKADGTIEYPTINYTHNDIGTHTYTVTEIMGNIPGVDYSEQSYTVTVTVTDDDHDGVLEIETSSNATALNFHNVYIATGTLEIGGTKILKNQTLEAGKYQFGIYNVEGVLIRTATNEANGSFVFEPLLFEQDDVGDDGTAEYIYIVKEIVPEEKIPGVTYDEGTIYYVKVNIQDNGEGEIIISYGIYTDSACTQPAENGIEFTNVYTASGSVTFEGEKSITGRDMTANDIFDFKIVEKIEGEEDKLIAEVQNDAEGKINYPEISYTLDDVGTHTYEVTETSVGGDGITVATNTYTVTVTVEDNGDGTLKITKSSNWNALDFVNTYNATGSITFEGDKSISGRDMTADDVFTFEVSQEGTDKTWTATNTAPDGVIHYPTINYTLADAGNTYTYIVTETSTSTDSITVDSKTYKVIVTITDDGKGNLTATKTEESDDYTNLDFVNVYNAEGEITFAGKKSIDSRALMDGETFSFKIEEKIGEDQYEVVAENIHNDANGNIEYPTIEYTLSDVGTHEYRITETSTDGNGITVATTVYNVIIEVKDDGDGNLTAEVKEGDDPYHLDFVNKYKAEGKITLEGTKTLTGRELTDDDEFAFEIREGNTVVASGTSSGGTITFEEIKYLLDATHNDVGTHTYTIVETSVDGNGITVDKNSYTVTVTVTDNGNGTLTATVAEGTEITFSNTYSATGDITFEGEKSIDGRDMKASDIFSFKIVEKIEGEDDKLIAEVQNDADGKINYPKINYSLEDVGTHTYEITETSVDGNGIKVATNTYIVTVTVEDNGDGTLKITKSDNWNALDFVNTYTASGDLKLEGTKTLNGRELTASDEFTFEVKEGNTVIATGTATGTANGGHTSAIDYANIHYTLEDVGTHTYTVTETSVNGDGITVATNTYTVTVTVEDAGNGTLNITKSANWNALNFTNTYNAAGSVTFEGEKSISGRTMKASDIFSFKIVEKIEGENDKLIAEVQNDADGKINYPEISYTLDDIGTHIYEITETSVDGNGITVATNTYTVTVIVEDGGNGTLNITKSDNWDALDFVNTYAASGDLKLEGTKTLTGRELTASDEFTFEVKEGNTVIATGTATGTANGGHTSAIDYANIHYTLEDVGTHTYTVTETSVNGDGITVATNTYTVTVTVEDAGNGTLNITKSSNWNALNFTNTYDASGDITFEGTKTLDGRDMTDGDTFTFEIKEGDTVVGEGTSEKSGKITYSTIEYGLEDLGEHTYTITETTTDGNGIKVDTRTYTVVVNVTDDGNGHLTATPTSGNIHALNFTNTYSATGSIDFEGTKRITGRNMTANDKFEFTLYDEEGNVIETVTNDAQGKIDFSTINYTLADVGEHTYVVKETSKDGNGITVDTKTYTIVVTVTDGGNGKLIVTTDNGLEDSLAFVNTYKADGELTLTGSKSIDKRKLLETDEFSFTLYDEDGDAIETVHQDEDGNFSFTTLTYDEGDVGKTFTYTVRETSTNGNGITVDTTVYTITVKVDDGGNGKLIITTNTDEVDPHHLDFQNKYAATGTLELEGTKSITGREMNEDDIFEFEVTENGKVIQTVTNDAHGKIDFEKIKYDLDDLGEHTYIVKETSKNADGITVDTTEYTVTVTVTDNGNGTLKVEVSDNAKALNFENIYEADGEITFSGHKSIDGRELNENDKFEFTLFDEEGNEIEKAYNDEDGNYSFETIEYDLNDVGEHVYTVKETSEDGAGITVDTTEYTITVNVTDGGKGKLEVTAETDQEGTDISSLNFTNKYEATGSVQLEASKELLGRILREAEFEFAVYKDGELISKANNSNGGKIIFDKIYYDLDDVGESYVYTIKEVPGNVPGVTYDDREFKVTVTITDNGDGTLNAEVETDKEVVFVNPYNADGKLVLEGKKTLEGRKLSKNDVFEFTVTENGEEIQRVKTDAKGNINFEEICYTLDDVGTHKYNVKEVIGDQEGITYDKTKYTVKVKVTDNGDGTLKVETTRSSDDPTCLDFVNVYNTHEEPAKPDKPTKTGDTTQLIPYVVILVSAITLLIMLLKRRRKARS